MDQILDRCDDSNGVADDIIVCGKSDTEHDECLYKFMHIACDCSLVPNHEKSVVKSTSVTFLNVYMMHKVFTKTMTRSLPFMPCPQSVSHSSRNS